MKKTFCIFLVLLLAQCNNLFSQFNNYSSVIVRHWTLTTRELTGTLNYADVEGTPYYTTDFIKGTVYLNNGDYASFPLRYDIFRDEIEFLKENKIFWVVKKDIKYVRYGSEMLIPLFSVSDTSRQDYFFLLEAGRYKLLKKARIEYNPLVPPKGYSETIPARFRRISDEFYIQLEGTPVQKIKSGKDLKFFFHNNSSALGFIKKEKIKAGKIEDLRKLVTFLNK